MAIVLEEIFLGLMDMMMPSSSGLQFASILHEITIQWWLSVAGGGWGSVVDVGVV